MPPAAHGGVTVTVPRTAAMALAAGHPVTLAMQR